MAERHDLQGFFPFAGCCRHWNQVGINSVRRTGAVRCWEIVHFFCNAAKEVNRRKRRDCWKIAPKTTRSLPRCKRGSLHIRNSLVPSPDGDGTRSNSRMCGHSLHGFYDAIFQRSKQLPLCSIKNGKLIAPGRLHFHTVHS